MPRVQPLPALGIGSQPGIAPPEPVDPLATVVIELAALPVAAWPPEPFWRSSRGMMSEQAVMVLDARSIAMARGPTHGV